MGSVGNQNPWAPYNTYKDCSQGICSIYCPQWCYIVFPPPPPFSLGDEDSSTDFSPLIIAILGILASAFILVSYYTIISKYCRRRHGDTNIDLNENQDQAWRGGATSGLDEAIIKSITVCKYKRSDGKIEGTDCSVCLSEFEENESLRLLPKCNHAFHLPCIDPWLKSHASCPLCRAFVTNILPTQVPPVPNQETTQSSNASALELQPARVDDSVVVIQESVCEEPVVSLVVGEDPPKADPESVMHRQDLAQPIRRSASLNSYPNQVISVADILRIGEEEEEGEDYQMRDRDNKNRVGIMNLVAMKRSISTGRFTLTSYEKGRSSMISHWP